MHIFRSGIFPELRAVIPTDAHAGAPEGEYMQRLTMVRYTTRPEATVQNEQLSRAVFDEIRAEMPGKIAYGLFRSGDEFIHLFVNTADDDSDAVTETPAFHRYKANLADRCSTPVHSTRLSLELLESYGLGAA